MIIEKVNISDLYKLEGQAELTCYVHDSFRDNSAEYVMPAVVIAPGGAYAFVSKRESEPIASYFLANGYNAFVLDYSVAPYCYPTQLLQLASAVDYVKVNAKRLHVNADRVFAVGFSAGGHLVGDLATEYTSLNADFGVKLDCKPTAAALCYPVINAEYLDKNGTTYTNLLGKYSDGERTELLKKLNLDRAVTADVPPCFIWTTAQDAAVLPQGALLFATKLLNCGVMCELHMYPQGRHGLATADFQTNDYQPFMDKVHTWLPMCDGFFKSVKQN